MAQLKFKITNMSCSSCPIVLQGLEDSLPGVRRVDASYLKQSMQVDYDETLVSEQTIRQAVEELGYTIGKD